MTISRALERALRAVEEGTVVRIFGRKNSRLRGPKGIGSQTLWLAKMNDFIADSLDPADCRVGMNTTTKQILTDKGQGELDGIGDERTPAGGVAP